MTIESEFKNGADAQVAKDLLEERIRPTHSEEIALFRSATLTVDDDAYRSAVEDFTGRTRALGREIINFENEALQITNFYETGIDAFVSENRTTTLVLFTMAGELSDGLDNITDVMDIADEISAESGIEILLTGPATILGNMVRQNSGAGLTCNTVPCAVGENVFYGNTGPEIGGVWIEVGTNQCGTNTTCP